MKLKTNILDLIKQDKILRRKLEDLFDKSFYTIDLWIKENNPTLCRHDSLQLIGAHLEMDIEDLYIMEEADFPEAL